MLRQENKRLTIAQANQHGQQLYFSGLFRPEAFRLVDRQPRITEQPAKRPARKTLAAIYPKDQQLALFYLPRDFRAGHERGFPEPPDTELVGILSRELAEFATRHGWKPEVAKRSRSALHKLLAVQDHPGAKIKASQLKQLNKNNLPALRLRDFLAAHDLLDDDLDPPMESWFTRKVQGLPEPMTSELRRWMEVLWLGSTTPPRSHPRNPNTVQYRLNTALPTLRTWAEHDGYESLREIKRQDVLTVLDNCPPGLHRHQTGSALRSIFKTLRAHKMVFRDPTLHIRLGAYFYRKLVPEDLGVIRDALNSPDPTTAALAALLAFHALRSGQLLRILLTDIEDGHLQVGRQRILLAPQVMARLRSYLDHCNRQWPDTANPHLFVHIHNVNGLKPATNQWIAKKIGTSPRSIRTDRIIQEVVATGGDIRRICDMFGLTFDGALPYVTLVGHPFASPATAD